MTVPRPLWIFARLNIMGIDLSVSTRAMDRMPVKTPANSPKKPEPNKPKGMAGLKIERILPEIAPQRITLSYIFAYLLVEVTAESLSTMPKDMINANIPHETPKPLARPISARRSFISM